MSDSPVNEHRTAPRFSICELSTLNYSFADDLRIYREAGAEGIGLCETKLPRDDDYDLEIFSDDGTFGTDFEDSLWKQDPVDVCRRGREGFFGAWSARRTRNVAAD